MASGAAKVEVTYLPSGTTVRVPEGTTLFNAAHWAGLPIESTCGGRGTCGKCSVKVLEGEAELSLADYRHLPGQARGRVAPVLPVPHQRPDDGRGAAADEDAEGGHDGRGPVRAARAQRREALHGAAAALARGPSLAPAPRDGRGRGAGLHAQLRLAGRCRASPRPSARRRTSPPRSSASTSSTWSRATRATGCSARRSTSGPPPACAPWSTCATARPPRSRARSTTRPPSAPT